jgi:hypothetical protein
MLERFCTLLSDAGLATTAEAPRTPKTEIPSINAPVIIMAHGRLKKETP